MPSTNDTMVTSIVNYKNVNEADLKKWLVAEFKYDDDGNPNFSYKVSGASKGFWNGKEPY
jgi:hypothetical protein